MGDGYSQAVKVLMAAGKAGRMEDFIPGRLIELLQHIPCSVDFSGQKFRLGKVVLCELLIAVRIPSHSVELPDHGRQRDTYLLD